MRPLVLRRPKRRSERGAKSYGTYYMWIGMSLSFVITMLGVMFVNFPLGLISGTIIGVLTVRVAISDDTRASLQRMKEWDKNWEVCDRCGSFNLSCTCPPTITDSEISQHRDELLSLRSLLENYE